jgi:gluconolactonase
MELPSDQRVEIVGENLGFTEGPVLLRDGGISVVSMTHGRVYVLTDGSAPQILAETEASPNGGTQGPDGALYLTHTAGPPPAKQSTVATTGGILRLTLDGELSWVTRDPISPNDLCFGPDGLLYVTDPTRPRRQDGRLWRIDVETGRSELLVSVPWHPNGIGFGPDDDRLVVASTHSRQLVTFPYAPGRPLGEPTVLCDLPSGKPDGFAFDVDGNILVASPAEAPTDQSYIHLFAPDGKLLDSYAPHPSNRLSNCALSPQGTLVVTDVHHESVLRVQGWPTAGLPLHPFR